MRSLLWLTYFFIKVSAIVAVVLALTVVAERLDSRLAGMLAGFPTTTAISLFFFATEQGSTFAARSALYNMLGLIGVLAFVMAYYRASDCRGWGVAISSAAGIFCFLASATLFQAMNASLLASATASIVVIALAILYFRRVATQHISSSVRLTLPVLLLRAVIAASAILVVTGIAGIVGPRWAGLFSAFPATIFPLAAIVHLTYGKEYLHTVLKNVPYGLISIVIFSTTIFLALPAMGLGLTFLLAFSLSGFYASLFHILRDSRRTGTG